MKKLFFLPILFLILIIILFFHAFLLQAKLPISADTIVGLYHPFRDLYAKEYPNGVPYKNFLITDPVRQLYPWRFLTVALEKNGQLPLWNPYSFAGTPLLANFQAASFYPLNIFLFILPFKIGWSLLVLLQPILAGLFLYCYLRYMRLSEWSAFFGGIVYAFCGFSTAWLEWNTLVQIAIWLPLILLAKEHLLEKTSYKWIIILIFAQSAAFFAGHLQIFLYMLLLHESYLIIRIIQVTNNEKQKINFWKRCGSRYMPFVLYGLIVIVITSIQWIPTLQFILESARNADQLNAWQQPGWFIPWQNLIQFIAPDFFGNPATLNYWGIWNYGEFIGYVGVFPLLMALFALFYRHDKKTFFFGTFFFLSLIFSLQTIFAKIPYVLQIPFLSSTQPTRLLFITDFSLSVLAALGFDFFLKTKNKKQIIYPTIFLFVVFIGVWSFAFVGNKLAHISPDSLTIAKHNLYFPTILLILSAIAVITSAFIKNKKVVMFLLLSLVLLSAVDLFRFSDKFIPFTNNAYLFPSTASLSYLQQQQEPFRIMTTDSEILPPNFSVMYHLQSLDGYDPLYLQRFGEMMAAVSRNRPDIHTPFGFNRIITPTNISSRITDLLGVQYVMSLTDLHEPKLIKVFTEGQTQIYKNTKAFPRVFFVQTIKPAVTKEEAIRLLFNPSINLYTTAIIEGWDRQQTNFGNASATIQNYKENSVSLITKSDKETFLVMTDTFYPTWHVTIDGKEEKIYRTDYNFRGIVLPKGSHHVIFSDSLL